MGAIYGSSYYEIVAGPSWTKAKENAISLGGNLASIQTSEENTYLFTNIVSTQSNHVWIGGSDQELEGSFKWSDNSPWSYANWASGEPNNASVNSVAIKGEDFAAFWLDGSGGWIDVRDEYYIEQGRVEMNGIAEIPLSYFSISDASFREGKGGDVTITRTGGTTTSQTLKIVSSDGSATLSDDDYAQVNKTVTFAAGETTKAINISTTADLNLESDESFSLTMTAEGSDDVPPQISDGSATVTIKSDDFERGNNLAIDDADFEGNTINLYLNAPIGSAVPSAKRFKVKAGRKSQKIVGINTDPSEGLITLTTKKPVGSYESIKVSYKDLGGDQSTTVIEDKSGNDMKTVRDYEIINGGFDETPPKLVSAELDDNILTMEFDSIISNTKLSKNRFKVKVNGKKLKVKSASVEDNDESFVNLVVQSKRKQIIDLQSEVTLSYRDPKGDQSRQVIEDLFGNDLLSVNSFFVDIV